MRLLTRLLRGFIKTGTLELIDAHGSRYLFGAAPGPAVVARIHDSALHIRLALNPELAAAEAYMDGTPNVRRWLDCTRSSPAILRQPRCAWCCRLAEAASAGLARDATAPSGQHCRPRNG